MTDHADRPTPRVAFYGRTNQFSQNGDRDIARQYRMCLAILPGPLIGFYYDTGIDVGDAHARVPAGRDAGGPPRWDGGNEELTARLNSPDADLDAVLLAAADRLPRQPARRERLLEAADRHGRQLLTASELSTLDSNGGLGLAVETAKASRPVHGTLRGLLLDGPNLLSAGWADYCVRAGLAEIIPRWWEPPPPTARRAGVASGNG